MVYRMGYIKKKDYYQNIIRTIYYNAGKLHGKSTRYYLSSERKQIEMNYEDGELHGEFKAYFSNMKPMASCKFIHSKIDGKYIRYNHNYKIVKDIVFKNGIVENSEKLKTIHPYDSSAIFSWIIKDLIYEFNTMYSDKNEFMIKDSDDTKEYNKFFVLHFRDIEEYNKFVNREKLRYESKKREIEISGRTIYYRREEYEIIKYYSNGKIKENVYYRAGKKNGKIAYYYPNGQFQKIYSLHNNLYEGLCKFYYYSGKIMGKGTFREGYLIGKISKYDKNGNLKEKVTTSSKIILDKNKLKNSPPKEKYSLEYMEKIFEKELVDEEKIINQKSFEELKALRINYNNNSFTYEKERKEEFSGIKKAFYTNGKLKYSIEFFRGELHGKYIILQSDGKSYVTHKYEYGAKRK